MDLDTEYGEKMIRIATKNDIQAINGLLEQVLYIHYVGRPDIFKEQGRKYTDEQLDALIDDENNPIFVYEDEDGNVIGHCFCQKIERGDTPIAYAYKTLYIDDLCVLEDARGKHIGRALYEYARSYAKENGYYNVTLHAWECNPNAVQFYEHLGLKVQQYTMEEVLK